MALFMGAALPALAVAAACWGIVLITKGLRRILLLLAAPMILASATPLSHLTRIEFFAAALLVLLALVPLVQELGPARPSRRAGLVIVGSLAVALIFVLLPPGGLLAASDLATGATIVGMAAGLLAASTLRPA